MTETRLEIVGSRSRVIMTSAMLSVSRAVHRAASELHPSSEWQPQIYTLPLDYCNAIVMLCWLLLLSDKLLAERCRTYWRLDAKGPRPLPSSEARGPQSSGAERPRLSLSARWILVDQEVSANQVVVATRRRWHCGGPPLELIEPGARKSSIGTTWPFQRLETVSETVMLLTVGWISKYLYCSIAWLKSATINKCKNTVYVLSTERNSTPWLHHHHHHHVGIHYILR